MDDETRKLLDELSYNKETSDLLFRRSRTLVAQAMSALTPELKSKYISQATDCYNEAQIMSDKVASLVKMLLTKIDVLK